MSAEAGAKEIVVPIRQITPVPHLAIRIGAMIRSNPGAAHDEKAL